MKEFNAVKLTDRVYWVGAIDWSIREFHGYATQRGSSYNAYLILAEKATLIDTVKAPFKSELMARIASVINPSRIKYIVSNHSEMDHSGCLPALIREIKPDKVFASAMGAKALADHFRLEGVESVLDGETLSLGNMNLTFMETRMLHWPDSMVSYLNEEEILFSQDGFGMHLASGERFDDEVPEWIWEYEAAKYYANILLPYSNLIIALLEKLNKIGLKIKMMAPDHGPVWRAHIGRILGLYNLWAKQQPSKKAVIAYDTMWQSTALMARAICEGLIEAGITVRLMPMAGSHRSDVVTELLDAGALLVGSPTLNNNIFPTMADLLTYIKGLRPKNLLGAAFGSYGWSGEAVKLLSQMLRDMKVNIVHDGIEAKYVPTPEVLSKCRELGLLVAKKIGEVCCND